MTLPDHFRQCMIDLDVNLARKLWKHIAPQMPQPGDDAEILATMHMARTAMVSLSIRLRAYSHRWCLDNGYRSQIPDNLKPSAERIYPVVVDGVGIACKVLGPNAGAAPIIRGAMETAVMDCYADKRTQPEFVRARMQEARSRERRKLFGK